MKLIVSTLASTGSFLAGINSQACLGGWWDEPECPKSLIK